MAYPSNRGHNPWSWVLENFRHPWAMEHGFHAMLDEAMGRLYAAYGPRRKDARSVRRFARSSFHDGDHQVSAAGYLAKV